MNVQTCLVFAMCLVTLTRVQAGLELGVDPRESSGVKVSVSSVRNRTARHWISQVCLRHSDDESSESAPWSVDVEPSSSSCSGTKSSLQVKLVFTVPDLPCNAEDAVTQSSLADKDPSPITKRQWWFAHSHDFMFQRTTNIPKTTSTTQQSTTAASTSTPATTSASTSTPATTSASTSTPATTSASPTLSGPEMAKRMTVGTRVVRGHDWKWGGQDGKPPGVGTIIGLSAISPGWLRVRWADNTSNDYRMGEKGYDLKLYEMN